MSTEDKEWLFYQEKISKFYDENNYDPSLQSWIMRMSHKLLEKDYGENNFFGRVIEIGAGTGEHLSFVRHKFTEYVATEQNPKMLDVARLKSAKAGGG